MTKWLLIAHHGIQDDQELAHTGRQPHFLELAARHQMLVLGLAGL